MDAQQVQLLEEKIEEAVAAVYRRLSHDRKFVPVESGRLYHLMAKAAVAVYEAVAENGEGAAR